MLDNKTTECPCFNEPTRRVHIWVVRLMSCKEHCRVPTCLVENFTLCMLFNEVRHQSELKLQCDR